MNKIIRSEVKSLAQYIRSRFPFSNLNAEEQEVLLKAVDDTGEMKSVEIMKEQDAKLKNATLTISLLNMSVASLEVYIQQLEDAYQQLQQKHSTIVINTKGP